MAASAGQQSVADALKCFTAVRWKAHSYVVNAVIGDDGRGGRFALDDSSRISGDLFGAKSGTRRDRRINLKAHGRSRNRVFETIEYIGDAFGALVRFLVIVDGISNLWRPGFEKRWILRKKFDHDGFGLASEVADHVLQDLDKFGLHRGFLRINLCANVIHDFVDRPGAARA